MATDNLDKYAEEIINKEKVTLKEFIAAMGEKPNSSYKGQALKEDFIIAFDTTDDKKANLLDFHVLFQTLTEMNPEYSSSSETKSYFYRTDSTTKTGTGIKIGLSGDVYYGDFVQKFLLDKKYETGNKAIVRYLLMSMKTGEGEVGFATCMVTTDRGGNVRQNATFSISLESTGGTPKKFNYDALEGGETPPEGTTPEENTVAFSAKRTTAKKESEIQ